VLSVICIVDACLHAIVNEATSVAEYAGSQRCMHEALAPSSFFFFSQTGEFPTTVQNIAEFEICT
jgi:hypothetical protein